MDPAIYQQLFDFGRRLLTEKDVNNLLTVAMDMAIEITGAERGLIILFTEEDKEIRFQTARNLQKKDIGNPEFEISRTLIDKVKIEGETVCLQNALDESSLKQSKSVEKLKVLSVICVPLTRDKRIFGVVYLDNRKITGIFKKETFDFIRAFANFISTAAQTALERKQLQNQISDLEKELRGKYRFDSIIGQHPKILEILQIVSQVADTEATVLIQGESGTGKELIARALHYNSSRRDRSFITVNCAALPEQLLESELFGHVKGAFTGAVKDRSGWFERADGSTIFLDEINDMSDALQSRLLRVLQTGDYSLVGSTDVQHCDVRVVAATSKNIKTLIKEGKFREELYYRLNVIDLWLPSLRERKTDIPLLIRHFLNLFKDKYTKPELSLSPQAEMMLVNYDFPGNIRELKNIIQRAVILTQGNVIQPEQLPSSIFQQQNQIRESRELLPLLELKRRESNKVEKNAVEYYLQVSSGHVSKAAKLAGLDGSNFHKLIRKHGIDPKVYKKV
jgi:Nif-specific regulatory protein